jgi:hypothetical protein
MASLTRWARTPDRSAATKPATDAAMARFEREVDPDGSLAPDVRATLAAAARRAHMKRLALASSRARARKADADT